MKRNRLLVVDDRELNRYLRTKTLRDAGYHIIECDRGREAIELARAKRPDLVLLDIHLPDINGLEVCRILKGDPSTADILVLQVSASAIEIADEVMGLEGGADGYLVEPVEPALLVAKVRSLLRLREAEERLRQSNARLKEFASMASHDLREPLRTMTLFAQLLEQEFAGATDPRAGEYITHIVEAGRRMNELVSSLLEYAQITTVPTGQERVDLKSVIEDVLAASQERISALGARVTQDTLPEIEGNRLRVTQLFQNLLDNALKYSRPGVPPDIHISVKSEPSNWILGVHDNGQGFEPEVAEQIFGIFKRLHGKNVPGSGLGLAICKAVVEQNGGRMWAEGSPGAGAAFFMTWPKDEGDAGIQHEPDAVSQSSG